MVTLLTRLNKGSPTLSDLHVPALTEIEPAWDWVAVHAAILKEMERRGMVHVEKGGPGSGHHGHKGTPGRGGSAPGTTVSHVPGHVWKRAGERTGFKVVRQAIKKLKIQPVLPDAANQEWHMPLRRGGRVVGYLSGVNAVPRTVLGRWYEGRFSEESVEILVKGGPGSGHHGHKGRPGQRGGSAPGSGLGGGAVTIVTEGDISLSMSEGIRRAYNDLPAYMRDKIRTIELHEEPGGPGQLGGNWMKVASWSSEEQNISMYAMSRYKDATVDVIHRETSAYISHEAGHAFQDRVWSLANEQDIQAYRSHSEWFDAGGFVKPAYQSQYAQAAPLRVIQQKWFQGIDAGEDGVSDYSTAWFSSKGNTSETFADIVSLRLTSPPDSAAGISLLAPTLFEAVDDMMVYFEETS